MPVGPSKQLKQTIQIEHSIVKNPNWPEASQLAIYKRGRGFELRATEKQIQVVARAGLELGTAGLRVRHSDHSATLPPLTTEIHKPADPCRRPFVKFAHRGSFAMSSHASPILFRSPFFALCTSYTLNAWKRLAARSSEFEITDAITP